MGPLGGVVFFSIRAAINVMILHRLVSEEGKVITITLESGHFSTSAMTVFTFLLMTSPAFVSPAGMMRHVIVAVALFILDTKVEIPRDGMTSVIVFPPL